VRRGCGILAWRDFVIRDRGRRVFEGFMHPIRAKLSVRLTRQRIPLFAWFGVGATQPARSVPLSEHVQRFRVKPTAPVEERLDCLFIFSLKKSEPLFVPCSAGDAPLWSGLIQVQPRARRSRVAAVHVEIGCEPRLIIPRLRSLPSTLRFSSLSMPVFSWV
jgi:hypothetical protein